MVKCPCNVGHIVYIYIVCKKCGIPESKGYSISLLFSTEWMISAWHLRITWWTLTGFSLEYFPLILLYPSLHVQPNNPFWVHHRVSLFIIVPLPVMSLRAGAFCARKPAGGEMFYKLIFLSRSLFSTHGFSCEEWERAAAGLTWARIVYTYLLVCPQQSSMCLISAGIFLSLFILLRQAWHSDSAQETTEIDRERERESLVDFCCL